MYCTNAGIYNMHFDLIIFILTIFCKDVVEKTSLSSVMFFGIFKTDISFNVSCDVSSPMNYFECCIYWNLFLGVVLDILKI